jgi:(E)-4-hydroxy-3-methylbut-2-enyl-diphosphate synthase
MINAALEPTNESVNENVNQVLKCVEAGAELVRISVPDIESANVLKTVVERLQESATNEAVLKVSKSLIADIHFHHKPGLLAAKYGFKCLRINPGTLFKNEQALDIIKAAKDYDCAIRIGINVGSLEERILAKYGSPTPEALVESAMDAIKVLEDNDFFNTKISVKASDVMLMVRAYENLAKVCDYPLHLGVTESGPSSSGTVKSSIGIGSLLMQGIGDTIRVSLSAPPEDELVVCWNILKSLGLRSRGVNIISCPSCARQGFDVIKIVSEIEAALAGLSKPIDISILGCVVNGIGEATRSHIGITGAWSGNHLIYLNGSKHKTCKTDELVQTVIELAKTHFTSKSS